MMTNSSEITSNDLYNKVVNIGPNGTATNRAYYELILSIMFCPLGFAANSLILYLNAAKGKVVGDFKVFIGNLAVCDAAYALMIVLAYGVQLCGCSIDEALGVTLSVRYTICIT